MDWSSAKPEAGSDVPSGNGATPVNHRLMQRLIATLYRQPSFATMVLDHYARDWDRAKAQDWGIDKELLIVHAAQARVMGGHGSPWPYVLLAASASLPVAVLVGSGPSSGLPWAIAAGLLGYAGMVGSLFLASSQARIRSYWERYCRPDAYDPSHLVDGLARKVAKSVQFCESTQPRNLQFVAGSDPFGLEGQSDGAWSLLIDRRKRPGGEVADEPVALDLTHTYKTILDRLSLSVCRPPDCGDDDSAGLPMTRVRIDDVAMVSGESVKVDDERFVTGEGVPRVQVSSAEMGRLADRTDPTYRVYKRVAYYDPVQDRGMLSFFRLAHQGPFTYVESSGTRLLPVVDRLANQYTEGPDAEELAQEAKGPAWWKRLSFARRQQIRTVGLGIVAYHLSGFFVTMLLPSLGFGLNEQPPESSSPALTQALVIYLVPMLAPLAMIVRRHGRAYKRQDDWTPRRPGALRLLLTLGLAAVLPYGPERQRKARRAKVGFAKKTGEWDYSPRLKAFRAWQSRSRTRTLFESTDLLLLRRTTDVALQEAFLRCMEEAGIDTAEFREGAAIVNNYGIINQSGRIEGGASVSNEGGDPTKPDPKPSHRASRTPAKPVVSLQEVERR